MSTAVTSRLVIRADANTRLGTGHLMRCLSLAQGWRRAGGEVLFVCAEITPALESRLAAEGFSVRRLTVAPGSADDARQTISPAAWIVADGYHFDAGYQRAIKEAGLRLLVVDDYGHAHHYYADFILNQNLSADPNLYASREPHTRLLLGPRYVLLREQFGAYRGFRREIAPVGRNVLVTLGGSDPDNVTSKVVAALRGLDVTAKIVVGGSNPHRDTLKSAIRNPQSEIIVDASNMPELMGWADVAIAAGGSTNWELAFMGLPSLMLVLADNQIPVAAALARAGVGINLGEHSGVTAEEIASSLQALLADSARREEMSRRGRALIDELGAARVVTRLRSRLLTIRRAQVDDARRLWEWANDPLVRASAFSPAAIPWADHQRWFAQKLQAANAVIFIAADAAGAPVGQLRLDWDENGVAEVDVHVAPEYRGAGFGGSLIRRAVDEAFAAMPIQTIQAFVKPDNRGSLRAFCRAGFRNPQPTTMKNQPAVRLALARTDD